MKDVGIVHGSAAQAVPIVIGVDTVYVHTDIQPVEHPDEPEREPEFQYHEVQYEKDEYIQIMADQNANNTRLMAVLLGVKEDG